MKYLDNILLCFGPILLNCVFFGKELKLLLKKLFLVSTDLLTGSEGVKPFGVLSPLWSPDENQDCSRRAALEGGHERIIHLILLKGRRQTGLRLGSATFRKMGRLLRRMADHRLTSTFKMAWIVESVKRTFDSELLPGKKSAVSFT